MNRKQTILRPSVGACVALAGLVLTLYAPRAFAQNNLNPNGNPGPFDFADSFYTLNGMDITQIDAPADARMCVNVAQTNANGTINWIIDNTNTSPVHNNCRVTQTIAVWNNVGAITYFNAYGVLANANSFLDLSDPNSQGSATHTIANEFRAFFAPKQLQANGTIATVACSATVTTNCVLLSAAEANQRSERIFDTATDYFCLDLLNLWRITYTYFTAAAFTPAGQAALAPIAAANGVNSDGTPILNTTAEADGLTAQGYLVEIQAPEDGSGGIVWIICSVIADPTNGAITPDAFLVSVTNANGTPVSPQFQANFTCLQQTGQFCTPELPPFGQRKLLGGSTTNNRGPS